MKCVWRTRRANLLHYVQCRFFLVAPKLGNNPKIFVTKHVLRLNNFIAFPRAILPHNRTTRTTDFHKDNNQLINKTLCEMMFGNSLQPTGIRSTFKIVLVASCFLVLFSLLWIPRFFSELQSASRFSTTKPYQFKFKSRRQRSLPDFSNGGIIVFYHIYKTGGSTVGKLLHELSVEDQAKHPLENGTKVDFWTDAMKSDSRLFFTMIRKHLNWERDCLQSIKVAEKKKLVLLELHVEYPASEFPSLVELSPMLDRWRAEAERRGLEFFAFSLLREPVDHALSFFNFFHVGSNREKVPPTLVNHDYWNPFKPLLSTERNFLHSYFANNRQCRMLSSDPQSTRGAPVDLIWARKSRLKADVDSVKIPCRVDKVYDSYYDSLDWVGTTENLSNETLPLLTKLVVNDASVGRNNNPYKVFDQNPFGFVGLKRYNLSDASISTILERTELDRALYANVASNFKLTDFGWDYQSPRIG